ncbi:MAG: hypothetical protein Q4B13_00390 [Lautropia sp.]|nr:hypothetical protein [Lautropia sp.]
MSDIPSSFRTALPSEQCPQAGSLSGLPFDGRSARHGAVTGAIASPAAGHPYRRSGWLGLSMLALLLGCSAAGSGDASTVEGGASATPEGGVQIIRSPVSVKSCTAMLAKQVGHTLKSINPKAEERAGVPDLPRPGKGVAAADPVYGNCVVRVTDHAAEPPVGFARHDYSRRQAFNADGSRILIGSNDGTWHLYDGRTFKYLEKLHGPAGDAELHWHPTDPDVLYFQPANGLGMKLYALNVRNGNVREVADFTDRLRAIWPGAAAAWTKAEGAPSADGRYWCFMVDDSAWQSLGVFAWDMKEDRILGRMDTHGDRPDHVSMSPGGRRCVVSGDTEGVGTRAWTRDFSSYTTLHHKSEHSDLAVDAQGRDVYVSIDYQSPGGDVFMTDLETGKRTPLFKTYLDHSSTAMHFSGRAFRQPGWVLVSTYAADGKREWLHEKLMAVSLSAHPQIKGLAYHHTAYNGYWTEPQATVNPDFTRVLFNSNWGSRSDTDIDNYMVVLPGGALNADGAGSAAGMKGSGAAPVSKPGPARTGAPASAPREGGA